ncbi:transglutaminase family protein [Pseudoduganella albidiflava]|uniref:Bacterial transglutaminase-like N-terminal domain-containing protein n=1 Tax=Pseudoduganella albidiflava TaxID=321983 RepID=A0AA87XYG5_9BURK|nr:hypothetical protein GCM10007387_59070 [Pseudoduganella albidiflava]
MSSLLTFGSDAEVCARYRVVHETRYRYQSTVTLSQQYLHLTPRSFGYQQTESHQIWLDRAVDDARDGTDYFGNCTRHVSLTVPHDSLLVHTESTVALFARPTLADIGGTLPWKGTRDMMAKEKSAATLEACRYRYSSPHVYSFPELEAYARESYTPCRPQLDAALELTHRIFEDFEFAARATEISTPLEQGAAGAAWGLPGFCSADDRLLAQPRAAGSVYILTHPPEGKPRLVGADASHAWVSVFCPSIGWVDFDPTNRCLVGHEHITLGWGRDLVM